MQASQPADNLDSNCALALTEEIQLSLEPKAPNSQIRFETSFDPSFQCSHKLSFYPIAVITYSDAQRPIVDSYRYSCFDTSEVSGGRHRSALSMYPCRDLVLKFRKSELTKPKLLDCDGYAVSEIVELDFSRRVYRF